MNFAGGDNFSALAIEGLVLEMLAEASRLKSVGERNEPDWLFKAKEYLHDNLSESIVCDDVARIAGVHPVHLARVFREKTGCTIGEYLRRVRIEFASRQISGTNVSLSEIALAAGFADQSHLTKTFKAHFGVTPSNYRRLCHSC